MKTRGSLARRFYVVGVVQLVLLIATAITIGVLTHPRPDHHGPPPDHDHGAHDRPPPPHDELGPLTPPLLTFACGLIVVGLGAIVATRSIVRPLAQLSAAARSLGKGDLRARSKLDRNDELGEVSETFDEMADRVQALVLAEKELLANVSHELRTPLARIRVALDLAAEGDAERARASLGEIAVDLGELETIIEDILQTTRLEIADARAETASLPLRRRITPAASIANESADRFRARHPERTLDVTIDENLPGIDVDAILFRRVIDNVLDNAHKYSPRAESTVALAVRADEDRVIYEVVDHGSGISHDDLRDLFTPFFRGEKSRTRSSGGVGLGLALAKSIVVAHGGTIDVTSTLGEGTTVRVAVLHNVANANA